MNRRYLLEQLNRSEAVTIDEMNMQRMFSDTPFLNHNEGHLLVINKCRELLRKDIRKLDYLKKLKALKKENDLIIKELDAIYPDGDITNKEDEEKYFKADGIICEILTQIEIIYGKKYFPKSSYNITDWEVVFKDFLNK